MNEGKEYEILLQKDEERIRKLSSIELILKLQCEKYAQKIDSLEDENNKLKIHLVRINFLQIFTIYLEKSKKKVWFSNR